MSKRQRDEDHEQEESSKMRVETLEDDGVERIETLEAARNAIAEESQPAFDACTKTFTSPSPIQSRAWPIVLKGQDAILIASTGSGKTLAFIIPAISRMIDHQIGKPSKKAGCRPRVLVLSPTRELCMQIYEVGKVGCAAVGLRAAVAYGGQPKHAQQRELERGVDLLVATPGRLLDFLHDGVIKLKRTKFLVLDEADRMLDMGFEKEVREILSMVPTSEDGRQTCMFSATWPQEIRQIASEFLKPDAVKISLSGDSLKASMSVKQIVRVVEPNDKDRLLAEVLKEYSDVKERVIIFALYKKEAQRLEDSLSRRSGLKVVGVHGDKSQPAREAAVAAFTKGQALILVATDVAARGLDIPGVHLVINYTFPLTIEDYVHRIGRTGRGGKTGTAVTFFTSLDKAHAGELQNIMKQNGCEIPPELASFGIAVKRKEHSMYGAVAKRNPELSSKSATRITFDD